MPTLPKPQLSHCGIYARDAAALARFYTDVLGLVISDQGRSPRMEADLIFLTAAPGQHHQLVIVSGRAPEGVSTVNQLSFKVADLDELKTMYRRVTGAGATGMRVVTHGNALSFYCNDPEGNGLEVYIDTPWYIPQPHGAAFDLEKSNDEIMAAAERACRESPGFMPVADWEAEIANRIAKRPERPSART